MVNFEGLEVVDYLRSGALIVAFLATVLADKKGEHSVWLTGDILLGGAFGAGLYLFPNVLLDYQINAKPDFMVLHLTRVIGATLLGRSIIGYYTSGSKDNAVTTAWLLCKAITSLSVLLLMINVQTGNPKKLGLKDQHFTFGILVAGLWTLGNVLHLFQDSDLGTIRRDGIRKDALSKHLIMDILLLGPYCILCIAAPDTIFGQMKLKNVTVSPLHLYLFRLCHIMFLTLHLFSLQAINFGKDNDKKAYFKGFLWAFVFIFPWGILLWWQGQVMPAQTFFSTIHQWAPFSLTCMNAMCANGCFNWITKLNGNLKWFKKD